MPTCGADTPAPADPSAAPVPSTTTVPAAARQLATQWATWKGAQNLAKPDVVNPVLMNHYDWYEAHNWSTPYPGEAAVYTPAKVPTAAAGASNDD